MLSMTGLLEEIKYHIIIERSTLVLSCCWFQSLLGRLVASDLLAQWFESHHRAQSFQRHAAS